MFKTGDKLLCINLGSLFEAGKIYTCDGIGSRKNLVRIAELSGYGSFDASRFILATKLNLALS